MATVHVEAVTVKDNKSYTDILIDYDPWSLYGKRKY